MPSDSLDRLTIDKSRHPSHKRGAGKRTRLWGVVFVVIAAGVVLLAVQRRSVSIETTNVSQVFPTQSFTLLNASGYVVAQRKAAVAAKTTGRLEWLGVEEGSRVTTGQVIARLENKDLDAAVRQNKAAVQSARSALDQVKAELVDAKQAYLREKELLSQGIVAKSEYDAAYARYKKAVAGVAEAEAGIHVALAALKGATVSYDYSLIRAPFDAVVLTKNADVGDIITPLGAAANAKAAVVSIADLGSLEVEADVSESNLAVVKPGQPCEVTLDALPNTRFRGVVHTIVPTADRTKASVMVKVRFVDTDPHILPEMSAKVAFLEREARKADQRPRIAVKPSAIVASGGRQGVYLVTGDRVVFTPITRGAPLGDLVEVGGVKSGDRVALKPLDKLKDGARIRLAGEK
ncbi:efflux RND transporter periplasmic adaptor subunit [Oryzomonas sagensis]|uniref:Efflux RND transporter periplasmic adaptor subunit n=1 Tax=Oryzomonas sagensis TaxID=2603857 RepID=A0ABQ6TMA2_9BACT|nr:efflux RND transporter periplasmic adaptor subunit [Oryzomonas sagensis]KAB0669589.1 efflux RND transporter periplasmic adaptor subunit [Oryzomonas sagensis]